MDSIRVSRPTLKCKLCNRVIFEATNDAPKDRVETAFTIASNAHTALKHSEFVELNVIYIINGLN